MKIITRVIGAADLPNVGNFIQSDILYDFLTQTDYLLIQGQNLRYLGFLYFSCQLP